ncbi:ThuA domain-containing protein [Chitinophaga horti]|uniref:ThuA domain-containing protein n=1 Tax=Chitinophaga horti TaxID=2920382 RepID=A0ABY6IWR5_9BACT|nr:ThuA domain-containing protein [Chitinophaga horti]UYQ91823.1 ThuA domain-containing protein [Chitinophaga horti]
MNLRYRVGGIVLLLLSLFMITSCGDPGPRVLVFTKTAGFYHESIPDGAAAIIELGKQHGFKVDTTSDATWFKEDKLKKYGAVIFLSTTGNVLNGTQQVAFERYIQAGGGFVGIHAAADTEYEWPWYNKLVGAYFKSHPNDPNVRKAMVMVTDTAHASTRGMAANWERTDEWYNYKSINPAIKVLAKLDENSYDGGENGDNHPIAWYHEYDGGRAFYTGGGHTSESFKEPQFLQHLLGGIQYAMGNNTPLDYSKAYAVKTPEDNRFTKTILSNDLNEPMELAVTSEGGAYFIERSGKFYYYNPTANSTKVVYTFPVMPDTKEGFGNGLLGLTIDPNFDKNHFIYFFYTPPTMPAAQRVSRFVMHSADSIDLSSEKVLITIPLELEVSAHTGGSLEWDSKGNLFISTGDNTVPFASDGYAPIDETPGRITFDAQRSASNTNDLRGKILRIHPEADGSYTIPEGNLFPKGTAGTRPEIYTMGCRNPYRISVDQATNILYWGEIGPDAGDDGKQGPRGYDEINQAKTAGNYGWPYFVGDNKPYLMYDFVNKQLGAAFNPEEVVNPSLNNTGARTLPAARKAMIWYPYNFSEEFPLIGNGGRSAMAGPVYHYSKDLKSDTKLPEYYDKALFIYDWMRNWIFAVRLDEQQNYKRMEPFMATNGDFRRPIDMAVGPKGDFYILEYGSVYGVDNDDARLVRVTYNAGNRKPQAVITTADTVGSAPLTVHFSGKDSYDYDEDELKYEWKFEGNATSDAINPEYTFKNNGTYSATLTVTDPSGEKSTAEILIRVGNTLPDVAVRNTGNTTFYFDNTPLEYAVTVSDKEDGTIATERLMVGLHYMPRISGQPQVGHQQVTVVPAHPGKLIMESSDCKACHQLDKKSVGPAFVEVAKKYKGNKDFLEYLSSKIIKGGGGVWGEHSMAAHPQLSTAQAGEIVKYIMTLGEEQAKSLPQQGSLTLKDHLKTPGGNYILSATYTDGGGQAVPLSTTALLNLRSAKVQAEDADDIRNINRQSSALGSIHNKSWFLFKNIDLAGVRSITYRYSSLNRDGVLEVHVKSPKGPVISTLNFKQTGDWNKYIEVMAPVTDPGGTNDLYFVFKKDEEPNQHIFTLDWLEFKK